VSVLPTENVPAETQSLGDAAYQRLWADIVSCRLPPGQRLTERSVAESTGFGISPIREALTRLDHEGLVRTLPRKGYQVTPLTLKSVDDLFTLWRIVAPEVMRLGVSDATAGQLQRVIDIFGQMAALQEPAADAADAQLHLVKLADEVFSVLAAATQNEYLITTCRRLQNDTARIWALSVQGGVRMPYLRVDQEWVRITERRDGDAAAARVAATLGEVHGQALRIFSRWPSVAASEITPLHA